MSLVQDTNALYPLTSQGRVTKKWSKQGNVIPAGSKSPVIIQAKIEIDFKIKIAAPDMEQNDFSIYVEENTLTVSVAQKVDQRVMIPPNSTGENGFKKSAYTRVFNVPEEFDASGFMANYASGVLNVIVPRKDFP